VDSIFRAAAVYVFVWLVLRVAGKRTLTEATTFDLVLLLIISETTQQAMIDSDHSVTNAFLLIVTLVGIDVMTSIWKQRSRTVAKVMDGVPLIILEDGRLLEDRARQVRVEEADVLLAARQAHGLERLDQIKYAVLERSGGISIIPKS
jgi:uncharacterized membrane protein YcaP (DUF421 family)